MMLHTKFQGHGSIGSGEEDFLRFLPYMGRASVSGRMDVIYVQILLPYAEKFDPVRMTYVQLLSVTSV